jgi:hypothetical protein
VRKHDGGRPLGKLSIILQWILRKKDEMALIGWMWLRIRTSSSFCKHGNGASGSGYRGKCLVFVNSISFTKVLCLVVS